MNCYTACIYNYFVKWAENFVPQNFSRVLFLWIAILKVFFAVDYDVSFYCFFF